MLLVVCAVFAAGMIALDPFGSDDGDGKAIGPAPITATTTASTTTARPAANLPATSAAASTSTSAAASTAGSTAAAAPAAGDPQVVYEVTARGSKNTGSVTYTDQDGDFVRLNGIPLPWRTTFPGDGQPLNLVLDAQRMGGGDNGPVTCTITVGGKVLSTTTSEGRNAAVLCGGTA